jgi:hypothetical protein
MAKPTRRRIGLPVPLALLVAALALAGCATAPSGGPPRQAPGGSNQVQAYVQQLPAPGPTSRWSPQDVVLGFLHASASYAFDPAAAKQYLAPQLRTQWHPGRGPVAVVGKISAVETGPYRPQILSPTQPAEKIVQFTGQHLATLSQTGQYQYAPGQNNYQFVLAQTNDVWLIVHLPTQQSLLLTESDFEDVYQPRNLFFFAPGQPSNELVPDPVYAPLVSADSALNTDLATGLVNGLLKGQGGWLAGATVSAFPAGTTLLGKVTIADKTARVDLGGAANRAQPITILSMAGQLLATLSDGEYSLPLASRLALYIDNSPRPVIAPIGVVPSVPDGPVLLITGTDSVGQLELPAVPKPGIKPQPKLGPAQLGTAEVTAVAASPDASRPEQFAVAVQDGAGCAVEVRSGSQGYQSYPLVGSIGQCNSLSYDANGTLWAAAGSGVWIMQPNRLPARVDLSALAATLQPGDQILALRMAPDAVRAALLVGTPTGNNNKLLLTAVRVRSSSSASLGEPVTVGAGLTDPLAITWYDAYHLAVLAAGGIAGIYDVPLSGGAGQQPGAAPVLFITAPQGADSLTTDGSEFVVGTIGGQVLAGSVSAPSWLPVAQGAADPIYPG